MPELTYSFNQTMMKLMEVEYHVVQFEYPLIVAKVFELSAKMGYFIQEIAQEDCLKELDRLLEYVTVKPTKEILDFQNHIQAYSRLFTMMKWVARGMDVLGKVDFGETDRIHGYRAFGQAKLYREQLDEFISANTSKKTKLGCQDYLDRMIKYYDEACKFTFLSNL